MNKGSRNRLLAFVINVEQNSGIHKLQFIFQERYDEILVGEQERGSVDANGKPTNVGQGVGRGQGMDHGLSQ